MYRDVEKRRAAQRKYDRKRSKYPARKAYMAAYMQTQVGLQKNAEAVAKYTTRCPERLQARQEVRKAIKSGQLVRGPCETCGESEVEAHHGDYSKPLEVRWLCKSHHEAVHHPLFFRAR